MLAYKLSDQNQDSTLKTQRCNDHLSDGKRSRRCAPMHDRYDE